MKSLAAITTMRPCLISEARNPAIVSRIAVFGEAQGGRSSPPAPERRAQLEGAGREPHLGARGTEVIVLEHNTRDGHHRQAAVREPGARATSAYITRALDEHAVERHERSQQVTPPWKNVPMSAQSAPLWGPSWKNTPMTAMSGAGR